MRRKTMHNSGKGRQQRQTHRRRCTPQGWEEGLMQYGHNSPPERSVINTDIWWAKVVRVSAVQHHATEAPETEPVLELARTTWEECLLLVLTDSVSVICGKPERINLLKGKKIPKPKPRTKDALWLTLVTWVQIVRCLSRPVQSELSRATKRQNREVTAQLKWKPLYASKINSPK